MKILICGAGIAGLTLAGFLQRHNGFDVTIVEKEHDWSHLGYTIGIWDVGRRILARLDKATEFDQRANRLRHFKLKTMHGEELKLHHFDRFYEMYESAYSHIDRKELHDILHSTVDAPIQMDAPITGKNSGNEVQVELSSGISEKFDIVVGADGVHSKVRDLAFQDGHVKHAGRRAWYAWVDGKYAEELSVQEIIGNDLICNIFDDPNQACAVFTAPADFGSYDQEEGRVSRLQEMFGNFCSPVPEMISSLDDEDLQPTDIEFVTLDDWTKSRIVLIGDAAHAMEPFGGIGASMAMEDAYVLADELIQLYGEHGPQHVFQQYQQRRKPRIETAREATRERYWWIHESFPGIDTVRKLIAPFIPVKHFTKYFESLLKNPL